jgi:hypothetical protein
MGIDEQEESTDYEALVPAEDLSEFRGLLIAHGAAWKAARMADPEAWALAARTGSSTANDEARGHLAEARRIHLEVRRRWPNACRAWQRRRSAAVD